MTEPSTRSKGDNTPGSHTDVGGPWDGDNQDWWDWYVSLADNDDADADAGARLAVPALPAVPLPDDGTIRAELSVPYEISAEQADFFRTNGYIKLKEVLSSGAVVKLRKELVRLLESTFDTKLDGGAAERFLSLEMAWLTNALIRSYVLSPRIAKICADLLGTPTVRLYHDNILSKEPGCGRTPWHFDDHHFPLDTHDVVTAWIPAQPVPLAMGPLAFAMPIEVHKAVDNLAFNKVDTSYDRQVAETFRANNVAVDESPFAMGEVSFHHNLSFHTAARNRTTMSRIVLANTFFADGAKVVDSPTMVSGDWQKFIPGVGPGQVAASELNPVCWPPSERF